MTPDQINLVATIIASAPTIGVKTLKRELLQAVSASQLGTISGMLYRLSDCIRRTSLTGGTTTGEHGELDAARKLLPNYTGAEGYTYVDVGAGDPIDCSNTWGLYQTGWRGVLIEPLPSFWYRLLRLRPQDTLLPIAVLNYKGYGRLRACGPCSSMRPDWAIAEHAETIVEVDTLANILNEYPNIRDNCQLCSIDVEGVEKQVLEGIDWNTFKPIVFIVEYRRFVPEGQKSEDLSHEWEPILTANGYVRCAGRGSNYLYTLSNNPRLESFLAEEQRQIAGT